MILRSHFFSGKPPEKMGEGFFSKLFKFLHFPKSLRNFVSLCREIPLIRPKDYGTPLLWDGVGGRLAGASAHE